MQKVEGSACAGEKNMMSAMAQAATPPLCSRLCKRHHQHLFTLKALLHGVAVPSHLNLRSISSAVGCLEVVLGEKEYIGVVLFIFDFNFGPG
jgi:hypothetical protein